MVSARNDSNAPLTRFCLAIEEHRRTPEGRTKTPPQFVAHFFTQSETVPLDRIFRHLPKEVRGPIISGWGIRGAKAALRDTDDKVAAVVSDALIAGDLSSTAFEDGLTAATVVAWVPLVEWWRFWRGGSFTKAAFSKAIVTAYDLGLFDAEWMFDHLATKTSKGTDAITETLSKEDLSVWIKRVHESKDGSAKGLLDALGWEKLIGKTRDDALLGLLDALAAKFGWTTTTEEVPTITTETPAIGVEQAVLAQVAAAEAAEKKLEPMPNPTPSELDLEDTGPYSSPSKKDATVAKVTASKAHDIPVLINEDAEIDETRRLQRRPMTTKANR